mmetsp:Transcript_9531/g.38881  ORF Transcript_9531/g.38881 Transcript_9531/m.38881 type:complete len:112 (+) Transcript_9531:88-423(+)
MLQGKNAHRPETLESLIDRNTDIGIKKHTRKIKADARNQEREEPNINRKLQNERDRQSPRPIRLLQSYFTSLRKPQVLHRIECSRPCSDRHIHALRAECVLNHRMLGRTNS